MLQSDGNLVLYTAANAAVWNTRTDGRGASFLQMQDDGNLVLYTAAAQPTWFTAQYTAQKSPAERAVEYAKLQVGKPYVWGGAEGGEATFDCSGLTKAAYAKVGVELPRVANDQYDAGPHPKRGELLPGDLVFFASDLTNSRTIHHVGIYVGGGKMINAPYTGAKIRYDPIDTPDYFGATRPSAG